MNNVKVTVAVVAYNHERVIAECLESILTQKTNFEFEIVVGDDASTDGTRQVIQQFAEENPGRVIPLYHEQNVGPAANYISVHTKARGEYIAHIDGDDLMLPGKLQIQVDFLDTNKDFAVCCHNMQVFIDGEKQVRNTYNVKPLPLKRDLDSLAKYGAGFCNSSNMYRRVCTEQDDIYIPGKVTGDWLVHMQKARFGYVGYIDKVLGKYRLSPTSLVHSNIANTELVLSELLEALEISKSYGISDAAYRYAKARIYYERAARFLEQHQYEKFAQCIKKSVSSGGFIHGKQIVLWSGRFFVRSLQSLTKLYWYLKRKKIAKL
ncbi:MAG: glycosyltransferase [Gammaproteobacteria bacterium]|nr:glycosyltransferase [Gammaproteobacteria bacterium]